MGMTGEQAYVLAKKLIEAGGGGGGGGTVDAYTKTQTDNLLIKKVDKEVGKGLFSGSYNDLKDAPSIPSKTSELQNDKGYLTEHQDLTDYAKKTDIPTVPSKVSEFENDKGYLTEHQDLSDYATNTQLNQALANKADKATTLAGYGITDAQEKLTNPLTQSDVVNDLNSSETTKPLSANQGRLLSANVNRRFYNSVSDGWIGSKTYEVGRLCIYDNRLWKCLVQHSGQNPLATASSTYWKQTSIDEELSLLNSNLDSLGIIQENSTVQTDLSSGIWAIGAGITLPAGIYIVIGTVSYQTNNSGYRGVALGTQGDTIKYGRILQSSVNDNATRMEYTSIVNLNEQTTVTVSAIQTSTKSLLVDTNIHSMRIK